VIARLLSSGEQAPPDYVVSPKTARLNVAAVLSFAITTVFCGGSSKETARPLAPVYDSKTGRLQLLAFDSNGNGRVDTWSYMDGQRVVRIEIDQNEDGKIDRWEYYDEQKHLTKVGFSRSDSGKADAWSYAGPDGAVVKLEFAGKDGRIARTERYEHEQLVSAEEDTDGDGRIDKWETYSNGRLLTVSFDTQHRGTPERRLVYAADGSARVESIAP